MATQPLSQVAAASQATQDQFGDGDPMESQMSQVPRATAARDLALLT